MKIPESIQKHAAQYAEKLQSIDPKLAQMYQKCYVNTAETALTAVDDGSYFVLTGDIPAMWLRDSTAEVSHYIPLAAEDPAVAAIIKGVIKRQQAYIQIDPYANAFKLQPDDHREYNDFPRCLPIVWERKYEIDSLCYPIRLAYLYWTATGDRSILDDDFIACANSIVHLWIDEQRHDQNSAYRFVRYDSDETGLPCDGRGNETVYTGMTWSGFRPSDDACRYGYLVASNMFAVVVLGYLETMLDAAGYHALDDKIRKLKADIDSGIQNYAVIEHNGKKIYACEVDGKGNAFAFDDANVPSLLSAPYLGYCKKDDPLYQNTRAFILSPDNPYYYEGKYARGVGSPHTPEGYIWHIALSMQGLTSDDPAEIKEILQMFADTDAGTLLVHEGFDPNDPTQYTRSWFSWSCALFSELCEKAADLFAE